MKNNEMRVNLEKYSIIILSGLILFTAIFFFIIRKRTRRTKIINFGLMILYAYSYFLPVVITDVFAHDLHVMDQEDFYMNGVIITLVIGSIILIIGLLRKPE